MNQPGRVGKVGRRLALVLGGLVVALLVAEGIGRLGAFSRGSDLVFMGPMRYPKDIYVQNGVMTYPNPRFSGTIQSFGYSVRPTFSAWGTRGAVPRSGERTWITVGDSFTIALQVKDNQTFSARLAEAEGVQVLNAGVDGYSTWKEALRTVQLGRHFPPEVVIASFFTGNDFFDNRQTVTHTLDNPGLGPGEPGAPEYAIPVMAFPMRVPSWHERQLERLRNYSVLAAHWWVWKETKRARTGMDPNARRFRDELGLFTAEGQAKAGKDKEKTEEAFRFFKAATNAVGARGVVAVMPPTFVMDAETAQATFRSVGLKATPDLDSAQRTAVVAAQAAGLHVCDMLPVLRDAVKDGEKPYLPFDGHLSVRGHEVVAVALQACIATVK